MHMGCFHCFTGWLPANESAGDWSHLQDFYIWLINRLNGSSGLKVVHFYTPLPNVIHIPLPPVVHAPASYLLPYGSARGVDPNHRQKTTLQTTESVMSLATPISSCGAKGSPPETPSRPQVTQISVQIVDVKGSGSDLEAGPAASETIIKPPAAGSKIWTTVRNAFLSGKSFIQRNTAIGKYWQKDVFARVSVTRSHSVRKKYAMVRACLPILM